MITAPYYSQFASRELINDYLDDPDLTASDPRWHEAGWGSPAEYAHWAWRTCGVACLRSLIGAAGATVPNPATVTQDLINTGGYVVDPVTDAVHGMIYAPAVAYLQNRWGQDAEAFTGGTTEEIRAHLEQHGNAVIASVTPAIRDLTVGARPNFPSRGGHLVLLTGITRGGVTIHNPSGYWPDAQADAPLSWEDFTRSFAGRGITVRLSDKAPGSS